MPLKLCTNLFALSSGLVVCVIRVCDRNLHSVLYPHYGSFVVELESLLAFASKNNNVLVTSACILQLNVYIKFSAS